MRCVIRWILAAVTGLCLAAASLAHAQVHYYHTDALGSVVAVTDANRNVLERREYEPYGAQLMPAVQDGPGYTGHVQDAATGLVYMQQRYYDPMVGKMLSVDPVTAYGRGDMRHFNVYAYAFNNPYRFTDPDGRSPDTIVDVSFTVYDGGRFLGAAMAWAHGKLSGNQALANEGWQGMKDTGGDLLLSGASVLIPGASAPMLRGGASAADAGQAIRAGHNGVEGPTHVVTRTTRAGEPAARITYPDGSVKDVSPQRVKEFVPNTHPSAPPGTPQRVRFDDAQPGTKGYKRDPTPADLKEAGIERKS